MRKYLKALMVVGQIVPLTMTNHLNFSENVAIITMMIIYSIIVIGGY